MMRGARMSIAWLALLAPIARPQCEVQILTPSQWSPEEQLGGRVAVFGPTAMASLLHPDSASSGSVLVYELTPGGWAQVQELLPHDTAWNGDGFGGDIALDDGVALIANTYKIYFFERTAAGWVETQSFQDGGIGESVSISGDRAASSNGFSNRALVYERGPAGWTEVARLTNPGGVFRFGWRAAISGDTLAVLSYDSTLPSLVHVYERQSVAPVRWVPAQVVGTGFHARDIDLRGDTMVLRSWGQVQVLERGAHSWVVTDQWQVAGPSEGPIRLERGPSKVQRLAVSTGVSGSQLAFEAYQREAGRWSVIGRRAVFLFSLGIGMSGEWAMCGDPNTSPAGRVLFLSFPDFATPHCFGGSCPCGNTTREGGCRNSTSKGATLRACGSGSVSADDAVLTASELPASQSALLFMGSGTSSSYVGDGRLCVGPGASGVFRFPVQGTGDGTLMRSGIVLESQLLFGPSGHIQAGDVWHFQLWYRDPAGPCAAGSNFTQAVSLAFGP